MKLSNNFVGVVRVNYDHWYYGSHFSEFSVNFDDEYEISDYSDYSNNGDFEYELARLAIQKVDEYRMFSDFSIEYGMFYDKETIWDKISENVIKKVLENR